MIFLSLWINLDFEFYANIVEGAAVRLGIIYVLDDFCETFPIDAGS